MSQVAVVIPAYNEADLVGATVTAAAALPGVDVVVVVDDGSRDATADVAGQAGAAVLRHARNRGKAAAMETGAEAVRLLDQREPGAGARHLLFLDADMLPDTDDFLERWLDLIGSAAPAVAFGGYSLDQAPKLPGNAVHRALALRRRALTLLHIFSMGLKSGL